MDNYLKVEQSFLARDQYCDGLPIKIHVEPSGICNLRCPICPSGRQVIGRNELLPYEIFESVFISVSDVLVNVIFSGWGEPLLNPATHNMIKLVTSRGVSSFMNTNGTLLEENAGRLLDTDLSLVKISLDGATSRSVHLYNEKFTFAKVVKGAEQLCELKANGGYDNPVIVGQFVISEETAGEMEELEKWALSLGVDQVKFRRMHHTMPGQKDREDLYADHDFSEILQNSDVTTSEDLSWTHVDCSNPWDSFFLSSTGKIGLCSFDPYLQGELSCAKEHNIATIWNTDYLQVVRRWHSPEGAFVGNPCKMCNRLPGQLKRKSRDTSSTQFEGSFL
jgi:MoaA/NifB/PqqE/SkfB family radical SAM enzyme